LIFVIEKFRWMILKGATFTQKLIAKSS
jgi:hypothetical protein